MTRDLRISIIVAAISFICSLVGVISPIHETGHIAFSWLSGVPAGFKDWSTCWLDANTWLGSAGGYIFEYIFILACASFGVRILSNPYGLDAGIGWASSLELIVLFHEEDSMGYPGMHALFYLWGLGVLGFCILARIIWHIERQQEKQRIPA